MMKYAVSPCQSCKRKTPSQPFSLADFQLESAKHSATFFPAKTMLEHDRSDSLMWFVAGVLADAKESSGQCLLLM